MFIADWHNGHEKTLVQEDDGGDLGVRNVRPPINPPPPPVAPRPMMPPAVFYGHNFPPSPPVEQRLQRLELMAQWRFGPYWRNWLCVQEKSACSFSDDRFQSPMCKIFMDSKTELGIVTEFPFQHTKSCSNQNVHHIWWFVVQGFNLEFSIIGHVGKLLRLTPTLKMMDECDLFPVFGWPFMNPNQSQNRFSIYWLQTVAGPLRLDMPGASPHQSVNPGAPVGSIGHFMVIKTRHGHGWESWMSATRTHEKNSGWNMLARVVFWFVMHGTFSGLVWVWVEQTLSPSLTWSC